METRVIYKCFISSPGDCKDERAACQKIIDDINNGLAKHLKINFEVFMWEYDVLPDMGKNGQEIIDDYIKKANYDIFIGIMKNRFGQPTKKAGSGTEHEYNDALKKKIDAGDSLPRIIFFFGKEKIDPDKLDYEQYLKVKSFKSKLGGEGIYVDFEGLENFEYLLRSKLELFIKDHSPLDKPSEKIREIDLVLKKLENDLSDSLKTYNEKSPIWIEPIISTRREVPNNPTKNDENRVELNEFINNPDNLIIKAPSEFGLTSLAHFIKLEAWKIGKTYLYIDSKKTKKNKIIKTISEEIKSYFTIDTNNIDCILLDSISFEESGTMQMIKNVCEEYKNVPIIILNTIDNNFFLKSDEDDKVEIKREFTSYYLLPLPQNEVRKIVNSYSSTKYFQEDKDTILTKVTKDLEILNMHRTAKNCISILRAFSRIGGDYGPVNRTKLLETILNTIFEEYEIPTYNDKRPDIKDCNFVLGFFCELIVLRNDFEFTEEFFKSKLREFCKDNYIDLDLSYLLNVLIDNSIFGKKNFGILYFKNAYWVFYFIAQRMSMNKEFLENVYREKRYVDYPEIIEFYTGIDRNKEDALHVLNEDLQETISTVRRKVNIPDSMNPFKSISWNPDVNALEKEEAKIGENVISSGLPDEVKDRYDDKNYNQIRPYNQVINSVIRDYSYQVLMNQISASSRALRNSDFVSAKLKNELLDKITQAWGELNKLLIILSPLLADRGNVAFEGANFVLHEAYDKITDPDTKRLAVLLAIPKNVVHLFKDDLLSSKMGPLLINKAKIETNSLLKHELMLMLLYGRPKEWHKIIDDYIINLDKNSFYLSHILGALTFIKDYDTTEATDKRILDMLASKCRVKHLYNVNNPDAGLIQRVKRQDEGSRY